MEPKPSAGCLRRLGEYDARMVKRLRATTLATACLAALVACPSSGPGPQGPKSLAVLLEALADRDPAIVGAAASALGLAASLDEADAGTPALTKALLDALPRALGHEPAVIEALGRAADASAQPRLADGLSG